MSSSTRFLLIVALFCMSICPAIVFSILSRHPIAEAFWFTSGVLLVCGIVAFMDWREEAGE